MNIREKINKEMVDSSRPLWLVVQQEFKKQGYHYSKEEIDEYVKRNIVEDAIIQQAIQSERDKWGKLKEKIRILHEKMKMFDEPDNISYKGVLALINELSDKKAFKETV